MRWTRVCPIRTLTALGASLALWACSEPTAPTKDIEVSLFMDHVDAPVVEGTSTGTTVSCNVHLRASAKGSGTAVWDRATIRWYAGKDRSVPQDSMSFPASDVSQAWGDSIMVAVGLKTSTWTFWFDAPYKASIDFAYHVRGGAAKIASVSYTCGPEIPPSTLPPDVTALSVDPLVGELEPGARMTVSYSATSSVGLLNSSLLLSGPCDIALEYSESMQLMTTRSPQIEIPPGCKLGIPFTVSASARDAAMQQTSRRLTTQLTLVDRTPPSLSVLLIPRFNLTPTATLAGTYFVGDTLDLQLTAYDNYALRSVVWEVQPAGYRDSVVISSLTLNQRLRLPLRPEWAATGSIELRLFARDASGLVSPLVTSAPNAIKVYPTVSRPTASNSIAGGIRDAVIDQKRGVAYVVQSNEGRVSVLALSSMQVVSTISLPAYPISIDLMPSGDSLVVALQALASFGVVDLTRPLASPTIVSLPAVDVNAYPEFGALRVARNGKTFVNVSGRLLGVDLTNGTQAFRSDVGKAGVLYAGHLERSIDHSAVLLADPGCVQRYDSATDRFEVCGFIVPTGNPVSVDMTGQRVLLDADVYDSQWQPVQRLDLAGYAPLSSQLTPDGTEAYFFLGGIGLVRSRVSDGRIVDLTRTPFPPDQTRISADGRWLFLFQTVGTTSRVASIDLR